jgi:hypothetical protein
VARRPNVEIIADTVGVISLFLIRRLVNRRGRWLVIAPKKRRQSLSYAEHIDRLLIDAGGTLDRKQTMKTPLAVGFFALLVLAASPAGAQERACRPSLSNLYHCPEPSAAEKKSAPTTSTSSRECHPSLSNGFSCPDPSHEGRRPAPPTASSPERDCRPSLSNGYNCPGTSSQAPSKKTDSAPDRGCRPSLSNGFNCPAVGQLGANQYESEAMARVHCPSDTVVWANTRSDIYHFRGTSSYGTTKAGAYMCEQAALAGGIRAAKNEKHP